MWVVLDILVPELHLQHGQKPAVAFNPFEIRHYINIPRGFIGGTLQACQRQGG
jgi:hypothetical protein